MALVANKRRWGTWGSLEHKHDNLVGIIHHHDLGTVMSVLWICTLGSRQVLLD